MKINDAINDAIAGITACRKPISQPIFSKVTQIRLETYRQTSNISRFLVGNKIVDHSDVVGASPVGTAHTASSFAT